MHKNKGNHHKRHSVSEDMNIKMKGLLKGLRYISHVFGEEEEKKEMMRIGFPTDVKHVAHIGPDSSAASTPSWMKEFQDANGGTDQSETLMAFACKPLALSSNEESIGSSSQQTMKTKSKESKQPRRRKNGKPVRPRNDATSTRAHNEEPNRPKKTRRRRVKKKDDGPLRSADKPSSNPPSAPSTDESGCNFDQSLYLSAHEASSDEGSVASYGTVASRWREV